MRWPAIETPVTQRGHDLFELDSSAPGKAGYLLRILQEHRLPESYVLQLYQQPFFFLLGAGMSGILNGILQRTDPFSLVDGAKVVSCLASCFSLLAAERLLELICTKSVVVSYIRCALTKQVSVNINCLDNAG